MTELLLANPELAEGWIDTSVGEAHVVRENLLQIFNIDKYILPQPKDCWNYPNPRGYKPLVQLLEEKHNAPVIITNGAKQALGAVFYALKQMGKQTLSMRLPYWALIPPLVKMHGLESVFDDTTLPLNYTKFAGADAVLELAPNNPDGWLPTYDVHKKLYEALKEEGIPYIHDAAYYTRTYVPDSYQLGSFGDAQIYSVSKMFGLSGLRLGYVVCHNPEFYKLIQQYMEAMTVGVSIVPQLFIYDLFVRMKAYPTLKERFEGLSSLALNKSKEIVKQINSDIIDVGDIDSTSGMFGWFNCKDPEALNKAKINVAWGQHFGDKNRIRMNLAFNENDMQEIVNRINSTKE